MAYAFTKSGYTPPSAKDPRNFSLEKAQPAAPFPVSYKTDISPIGVFMQEKLSDCVENGITFVKKYHEYKNTGKTLDLSRRSLVIPTVQMDGFPLDDGTNIQNALSIAHKRGIAESVYINDNHQVDEATFVNPAVMTTSVVANALTHTIGNYAFVTDLTANGLKNAIYQNGVVVIAALINQNWWTDVQGNVTWEKDKILPIRPPITHDPKVDSSLSGHVVVLYGYDDTYFYGVNSFSSDWGDRGYFYFKVDELPFIFEAATIVDLTPMQVQTLKQTQQEVQQIATVVNSLPKNPNPVAVSVLSEALTLISNFIKTVFKI